MLSRSLGRALALGAMGVSAAVLLASCDLGFIFPSRPSAPLFAGLKGGSLVFRWCGPTSDYVDLLIQYRVETSDRESITAAQGEGAFQLRTGSEFSAMTPPSGLNYVASTPVPITEEPTVVLVTLDAPDPGRASDFVALSLPPSSQFADGVWVGAEGIVDDEPCSATNRD
jgi:hypothetical protein